MIGDPFTGEMASHVHPRQHIFSRHFAWDAASLRLVDSTALGGSGERSRERIDHVSGEDDISRRFNR